MGFLKNIFSKKETPSETTSSAPTMQESATLEKYKINLDKTTINLTKSTGINFDALKSKVKLVLDYSGSMTPLYSNGTVQKVITKLLPLALKFDDDGELDCFLFSNGYKSISPCTGNNYPTFVANEIYNTNFTMSGTEYAPVLNQIHSEDDETIPSFVIFITDGDNYDKDNTDSIIKKMSTDNCFVIFVGIGSDNFDYLSKLDNLSGRPVDNTGFIRFADIGAVDENTLYDKLLTEYASWLKDNG